MAWRSAVRIELDEAERCELEARTRRRKISRADAMRAEIVLLAADGGQSGDRRAAGGYPRHGGDLARAVRRQAAGRPSRRAPPGAPRQIGDEEIADMYRRHWRRCRRPRPTGACARWRGPRACRSRRCIASGGHSVCSRIARNLQALGRSAVRREGARHRRPVPRPARPRRRAVRRREKSRSRRSTAPSRSCRCGRAKPSGAPTTISGTARPRCSLRSMSKPAR